MQMSPQTVAAYRSRTLTQLTGRFLWVAACTSLRLNVATKHDARRSEHRVSRKASREMLMPRRRSTGTPTMILHCQDDDAPRPNGWMYLCHTAKHVIYANTKRSYFTGDLRVTSYFRGTTPHSYPHVARQVPSQSDRGVASPTLRNVASASSISNDGAGG